MFGTYSFTATSIARRLTLGGVAAAALLGLTACQATTATSPPAAIATPSSGAASASPGSGQGGNGAGAVTPTSGTGGTGATGGTGGTSAAPTNAPIARGLPECSGGQIKVTTASQGAAMSHSGLILIFTNTGNNTCSLTGYPGASLPDSTGTPWNATRTMFGYMGGAQGYSTPPTVNLAPGNSASAVLEWASMPVGGGSADSADCPGLDSVHLLVTPPNTQATATFPPLTSTCQEFQIHPVVPGSTGQSQP